MTPRIVLFSLVVIFFTINHISFGQIEKIKRIEFATNKNSDEEINVFPLVNNDILAIIREQQFFNQKKENWNFIKLDTDFNKIWETRLNIDSKYQPISSYSNEHEAFWLFHETQSNKYLFLKIDLHTGLHNIKEDKLIDNIEVHQFKIIGSKAVIYGQHRFRPVAFIYSFFDQSTRILPGLYEKNTEITHVDVQESNGTISVLTYAFKKRNCQFDVYTYNYEGKLIDKTQISDPNYSIISGQIVPFDHSKSYLIGNYANGCTQFSQGLYITQLTDEGMDSMKYLEFSDLQNFFNYLKPKQKERYKAKLDKRKSLGKENKFRYRLLVHPLFRTEDEIIMVAEIYYPNNKPMPTNMPTNYFNRTTIRSFSGYRFTHAVVCAFDLEGNYKWDNSVKLKDVNSYELKPMVQLNKHNDYYILAYPYEDDIYTEIINKYQTVEKAVKHEKAFKSNSIFDKESYLSSWYDQYFLRFGKEPSEHNSHLGEVHYITKVQYSLEDQKK